jgi:dephospho-CoA kinase
VPLLFEAGVEGGFDTTVAIVADEQVRAERAAGRNHRGVDERAARQLTQEEKAARADHVIHNDGSLEDLERQVRDLMDRLVAGVAPS